MVEFDDSLLPPRFWSKATVRDGHWLWTAGVSGPGYGSFWWQGRTQSVHTLVWLTFVGEIPVGLVIAHCCHDWAVADGTCAGGVCWHRRCFNPEHLGLQSDRENLRNGNTLNAKFIAKTHCPAGHPYSGSNLIITHKGFRECRECKRIKTKRINGRQVTCVCGAVVVAGALSRHRTSRLHQAWLDEHGSAAGR